MTLRTCSLAVVFGLMLAGCSDDTEPSNNQASGGSAGAGATAGSGGSAANAGSGGSAGIAGSAGSGNAGGSSPEMAKSDKARLAGSDVPAPTLEATVDADNAFAFDLYESVRAKDPGKNAMVSPMSVSLALSMTYAGARNNTAAEMATALHFPDGVDIHAGHNALTQIFDTRAADALDDATQNAQSSGEPAPSPEDFRFHVVNSVWGDQTYTWENPFLDVLAQDYGSGVYLADFINNYDNERTRINSWVSDETKDKINNLLPPNSLTTDTRMVLVNAMHIKLPWMFPFEKSATAPGTFTKADGATIQTDLMKSTIETSYFEDDAAQIAWLPLAGSKVSLVVALPKDNLESFEAGFTQTYWQNLNEAKSYNPLNLTLPKFKFTSDAISLKDTFDSLGMHEAFDAGAADFYGMCMTPPNGERLFVSDIFHKAMMGVDENGVEAAAATAVIVSGNTSEPPPPVDFIVNKPFMVALVDQPTGSILFLGHIYDPTDQGNP